MDISHGASICSKLGICYIPMRRSSTGRWMSAVGWWIPEVIRCRRTAWPAGRFDTGVAGRRLTAYRSGRERRRACRSSRSPICTSATGTR
jgi:hypothetical protein